MKMNSLYDRSSTGKLRACMRACVCQLYGSTVLSADLFNHYASPASLRCVLEQHINHYLVLDTAQNN